MLSLTLDCRFERTPMLPGAERAVMRQVFAFGMVARESGSEAR